MDAARTVAGAGSAGTRRRTRLIRADCGAGPVRQLTAVRGDRRRCACALPCVMTARTPPFNDIAALAQRAKLRLIVEAADEVRGGH